MWTSASSPICSRRVRWWRARFDVCGWVARMSRKIDMATCRIVLQFSQVAPGGFTQGTENRGAIGRHGQCINREYPKLTGGSDMNRPILGLVAAALLFLAPHVASATVVYSWQPLTAGVDPVGDEFLLDEGKLVATAPLQFEASIGYYLPDVDYHSPFSLLTLGMQGGYGFYLGPNLTGNLGAVDVSMDMTPIGSGVGSLLEGSLQANNAEMDFLMTSSDGIWSIVFAHSDFPGCFSAPGCSGGTGQWVLTEVPEPRSLGIVFLALGALGMMLLTRRRGSSE